MKLSSTLLLLAASAPLAAQTTTSHAARPAGATGARTASSSACAKLPELSSKIPSLPAGTPCAKHLYSITTIPNVRVENISAMEPASLKEDLGIESSSFSLDYVDTKAGTGTIAPGHGWYTINYTGYLLDGTTFDTSVGKEPITIAYGQHQVIPGWDTGFAGMHVGGKRRLFIPYQLAYGAQPHGPIPTKSMLVFDVDLVSVSDTPPKPKTPPTPPASATPPASTTPPAPSGTQPPPSASAPGSPTKATPPSPDPARPATVPPPTDPTQPTSVPPKP